LVIFPAADWQTIWDYFPKSICKKEKTTEEIATIGYFIIKYIERFELNDKVGGEPQIWFIPDAGQLDTPSANQYKTLKENTDERLVKHERDISDLNF
jgi:hypothetical protein